MNRWLTPRTILGIAIAGVILYSYPGLVSYDSVDQLAQGRHWQLGDWHPPAMSALWRVVELFVGGPFGMLVLQTTALVLGAYAIVRDQVSLHTAAIVALAIAWFPPILTVTGVIWSDPQMAGYLLVGIAALLSPRPRVRLLGLLAFVLASALRHNALAATFAPLALLWGREQRSLARRYALAVVVWIAVTAASLGINAALVTEHQHPFARSAAPMDISGIIHFAPPITDAALKQLLSGVPLHVDHELQQAIAAAYEPRGSFIYFEHPQPLAEPATPAEFAAVAVAWRKLIAAYPLAYAKHRATVFQLVVQARARIAVPALTQTFAYIGTPELDHELGLAGEPSLVQRGWFWWVRHCGAIWYAPLAYLVISLVLLGFVRGNRVAFAVLGSSLGYELTIFFLAPAADYRYSHYLLLTTLIALVLVIAKRARRAV